jgi:hypothetical protein
MVVHICHPSYSRNHKIGGSESRRTAKSKNPISKITRTGSVAQTIKHLIRKCEAMSSNPRTKRKEKKKTKQKPKMKTRLFRKNE